MEVIRSKVAIAHDQAGCEKLMDDLYAHFNWHNYDKTNLRLYISADTYLEYTDTNSDDVGNVIRLYNTSSWNGNYAEIADMNGGYINFQMFKVSTSCCAIAFKTDNSLTDWNAVPTIAIDTYDGGTAKLALNGVDGTVIGSADGTSPFAMQPWAFKTDFNTGSISASYSATHIAPVVIPRSGYVTDHLHVVLFAPVSSGQFVSLNVGGNAQTYYFSKGLALPCGSSISYTNLT